MSGFARIPKIILKVDMLSDVDVVILCGGLGTRLGALTQKTPKPLLKIGNVPFLFFIIENLHRQGFRRFFLAAHYLSDQFFDFAKEHEDRFPNIKVIVEETPLGTGGSVRHAAEYIASKTFIALNGDTFIDQPLVPVMDYHLRQKNIFTLVAVSTLNVEGGVRDKGGLVLDGDGTILDFQGHQSQDELWVNGGLYAVEKQKIMNWPLERYDLEKNLASLLAPDKPKAFCSESRLLDIGKPACFEAAAQKMKTWEKNQWI